MYPDDTDTVQIGDRYYHRECGIDLLAEGYRDYFRRGIIGVKAERLSTEARLLNVLLESFPDNREFVDWVEDPYTQSNLLAIGWDMPENEVRIP